MDNQTSDQGETLVFTGNTTKQKCPFCDEQLTFTVRDVANSETENGGTQVKIWLESNPASTEHVYRHQEEFRNFPQRYIPLPETAESELMKAGLDERAAADAAEAVAKFSNDARGQQLVQDILDRKSGAGL